jgi:hypothetical protein
LSNRSECTLKHNFHPSHIVDSKLLNEDDLDESQLNYLKMMYECGVSSTGIVDIMNAAVGQKGKQGDLSASIVKKYHKEGEDGNGSM